MTCSLSARNKKICVDVTRALTVIFTAAFEMAFGTLFDAMSEPTFTTASDVLDAGELHVWSTPLITDFPSVNRLSECLSFDERARAARARDAAARARFITARVALRHILAGYLRRDPRTLTLRVERLGKPVVDDSNGLHFSVSHSGAIALLSFARAENGVDVERTRELRDVMLLSRRILHPSTCALLEMTPVEDRLYRFLQAWTQREAHVKALGGGLFHTADTVPFAPVDDAAMGTIRHVHERAGDARWSVAHFHPDASTIAAVVARGDIHTLRFLHWSPEHGEHE
jgi:4'-phosphopantetheinyl transferase